MPVVTAELFTWPLGDDAVLIPRTVAIAEPYQALLTANHERLASWFPGFDRPPTLHATRADLELRGQGWLAGTELPLAVAVRAEDGLRLAGAVNLLINGPARSGEVGYWLDSAFEGRGLVTRAVTALLDHAFGPLGLDRVELRTVPANTRSQKVAERLGFVREGILREAAAFPGGRQDEVVFGLLAREWPPAAN